jgi:ribosomal protein S18 acetylase RimI-like enzyme
MQQRRTKPVSSGGEPATAPDDPTELWAAARRLGMELDLEWTFSQHVLRVLALSPETGFDRATGIDLFYERLSDWADVLLASRINAALHENDVRDSWLMDLAVEMDVFDSIYRTRTGELVSKPGDSFRGRHAVSLMGLTSNDDLIFPNTWGPDWGDHGLGYISRSYFERHARAVWLARPSWLGWSPSMEAALAELLWQEGSPGHPSESAVAKAWTTPNRIWAREASVNGLRCLFRLRQVMGSPPRAPLVEVIDISAEDRILGRVHLELALDSQEAVVQELFVRPDDRRRGIGMALLGYAEERAKAAGRQSVSVTLHEADNSQQGAERARSFLVSSGYQTTLRDFTAPYLSLINK